MRRIVWSIVFALVAAPAGRVAGQSLRGTVTLPGGEPATGASVALLAEDYGTLVQIVAAEDGGFELPLDGRRGAALYVLLPGHAALFVPLDEEPGQAALALRLEPIGAPTSRWLDDVQFGRMVEASVHTTCGARFQPERHGVLAGAVHDPISGLPLAGARVRATWRSVDGVLRWQDDLAGPEGAYLFCDLPAGEAVLVNARMFDEVGSSETVGVESGSVQVVNLKVALSTPSGTGWIFGRVVEREILRPIVNAEVRLRPTSLRLVTDARGFFSLDDVPTGTYQLEVSHLGYAPWKERFTVYDGRAHDLQIGMSEEPVELDGLEVAVQSRFWFGDMRGMQRRMAAGFGHYIMPETIELRGISRLSDALRGIPSIRVRPQGTSGAIVFTRGKTCIPQVFVDGQRYKLDPYYGFNEPFGADLYAIEVYPGPASVPGEFRYDDNDCGAVVVWTKRGRR